MDPFVYQEKELTCDGVSLAEIAKQAGTPSYVYSAKTILDNFRAYDQSFGDLPHTVYYALKASSNLHLLRLLAQAGAGFDIVSGGELFRVIQAGGDPAKVVFSGVGKTAAEIDQALIAGIHTFNCESEPELALIDALAHRRGIKARVALRVNPDVDVDTHHYTATGRLAHKFGIDIERAPAVYEAARQYQNLLLESVSCHIGSGMLDPSPLWEAADRVLDLIERLRAKGFDIKYADFGGGLGVAYRRDQGTPVIEDHIQKLCDRIRGKNLHAGVEPGRSIVASAGALVARVLYRKKSGDKDFVIVDAAMNDLIRPALYQAHHEILPLRKANGNAIVADVVGPVCETGDFLAKDRELPELLPGDMVAVLTAGAYGFSQASNYNTRPRAAEVLVEEGTFRTIRRRESYEDLIRGEE